MLKFVSIPFGHIHGSSLELFHLAVSGSHIFDQPFPEVFEFSIRRSVNIENEILEFLVSNNDLINKVLSIPAMKTLP